MSWIDLPASFQRKQKLKIAFGIVAVIVVLFIVLGGLRTLLTPSIKRSRIITAIAEVGSIEDALVASGTVIPEHEQVITSPVESKIDSIDHKAGDIVSSGESIVKLNDEFILIRYKKLQSEHDLLINQLAQRRIELERQLIDQKADFDIKSLQTEFLQNKFDMERQLMELGAGTKEAMQLAELNLTISQRELEQLEQQIENSHASATSEIKEQELQIQISKSSMDELKRQIELAEIRAGRDGVVTWVNNAIGSTVHPGDVVARIADLRSFKVEATISDIHSDKLTLGARAKVRINEQDLTGAISSIQPTIKNGVVTFFIELDDKTNPALRSNLRVDAFVIRSSKDNVVRVRNGPFVNGSGDNDIFIIKDDEAIKVTVSIGATNFDFVELMNQVESGDEIIISDMEKYMHHQAIKIKND